jgi:hypothetical protein
MQSDIFADKKMTTPHYFSMAMNDDAFKAKHYLFSRYALVRSQSGHIFC